MDCEYTDTDDVLIDAIIAGVRHVKVQERFLDQGSDLTLAKPLSIGRQYDHNLNLFQELSIRRVHIKFHVYILHRKSISQSLNIQPRNIRNNFTDKERRLKRVVGVSLTQ